MTAYSAQSVASAFLGINRRIASSAISNCNETTLLASGSSVNVYSVCTNGTPLVIKELMPTGLCQRRVISVTGAGRRRIKVKKNIRSLHMWSKAKIRFLSAYALNKKLQNTEQLTNFIVPVHHCIRKNGTLYSVSAALPGKPLDKAAGTSLNNLMLICLSIARMTDLIHQSGWLVVDIKAENYIVYSSEHGLTVKLTDFDSAVRIHRARRMKKFMCSNLTASPEAMSGRGDKVSVRSDVYSVASMMTMLLAGKPVTSDPSSLFDIRIRPFLKPWSPNSIEALKTLLLSALQSDPDERPESCGAFAHELQAICKLEGIDYENLFA